MTPASASGRGLDLLRIEREVCGGRNSDVVKVFDAWRVVATDAGDEGSTEQVGVGVGDAGTREEAPALALGTAVGATPHPST